MRVLVGMSGGVDSSVAAALLAEEGHEVVGVTMRLWGGDSDTGCCSVADVDDARRVAQQLGLDHVVFNFSEDFESNVVEPYVSAHAEGITPNPCIECNRHLKFDRLSERARVLGFDAVATGHHARLERDDHGRPRLARGADRDKDQSYVVHMVDAAELEHTLFPIGHMTKSEVREHARRLGLRTAGKPDSQDVCFITSTGGRERFLGDRIPLRSARVVDTDGRTLGEVPSVEMVTIGQRRGLGLPGGGPLRYVVDVVADEDPHVVVGDGSDLLRDSVEVAAVTWVDGPVEGPVRVQVSAHGPASPAECVAIGSSDRVEVRWAEPQRRVAPGQSVVFYDVDDRWVLGGGVAAR
jgi:tRNA-specific 2-thiouridylase